MEKELFAIGLQGAGSKGLNIVSSTEPLKVQLGIFFFRIPRYLSIFYGIP